MITEKTIEGYEPVELKAVCPIEIMRRSQQNSSRYQQDEIQSSSVTTVTPPSLGEDTESVYSDDGTCETEFSQFYLAQDLVSSMETLSIKSADEELSQFYPSDPELPWHFCWVDDGMIAGMSAPVEKYHWKALKRAGVGLVVNLTEDLIAPTALKSCDTCEFQNEYVEDGIFDDLDHDMKILLLPVQDGNIPRWEQLKKFIKHAEEAILQGKKVAVHCQAGVGRTGTFLAVHIMEKYKCSAQEAINRLRKIRPQSLQFHSTEWQQYPFKHFPSNQYVRNYVQERFIELYHRKYIQNGDIYQDYLEKVNDHTDFSIWDAVDHEIFSRLRLYENTSPIPHQDVPLGQCAACSHVISLGPIPAINSCLYNHIE